jgi:hypothetical protein
MKSDIDQEIIRRARIINSAAGVQSQSEDRTFDNNTVRTYYSNRKMKKKKVKRTDKPEANPKPKKKVKPTGKPKAADRKGSPSRVLLSVEEKLQMSLDDIIEEERKLKK